MADESPLKALDGGMSIPVRPEDLEFRVKVPPGCRIVAALELPSGQLIALSDLTAEDAAGVPVAPVVHRTKPLCGGASTGPVDEEKVRLAREVERVVRKAARGALDPAPEDRVDPDQVLVDLRKAPHDPELADPEGEDE